MAGKQISEGDASSNLASSENKVVIQGEKGHARRRSSQTNSCSGSIEFATDLPVAEAAVVVGADGPAGDGPFVDAKLPTNNEVNTSYAQESNEGLSNLILHETEPEQIANKNNVNVVDESDAVSDISHSESDPSIDENWMINNDAALNRRSHTICSVITNQSDHSSIQSLRENVDRIMSSHGSLGRSRSNSRDCMQKNLTPAVAAMLYDQNYYRSADWLRFVPRRSSCDDMSSESNNFSGTGGSHASGNAPPERFYRMFDNTRIGLHSAQGRTIVRQHGSDAMHGDKILGGGRSTSETGEVENFRAMHPDLVIDSTIDEEAAAGVVGGAAPLTNNANVETMSGDISNNFIAPPTKEIICDPNSVSCQIVLEEECENKNNDTHLYSHEQEDTTVKEAAARDETKLPTFQSSLRKGAIVRPSNTRDFSQNNIHICPTNLPEHIREEQMHMASWDSKYETYACRVDQNQDDRAVEIPVFSMARPHMRAFHFAWLTFFFVFVAWFSIAPLLGEIQISLNLTKEQIWTSSIASVAGGLVTRCIMGVLCDIYGARLMSAAILFTCGIPTCFTGFVNTSIGLSILRLVIGTGGSAFVTCQYWTSTMFTREVAGTANALAAGWGNLGGGVTLILTGSILFPFLEWIYGIAGCENPADLAWRTSCILPGLICAVFTFAVVRSSDDSPKGNYQKRKRLGLMQKDSAMNHLKAGILDYNTWILLIQYGCCFGVELTTSNALALYFKEEFELSTAAAAAVASTFGFMNLFCRGLGGFCSDVSNAYKGMRGRLFWQHLTFFLEGVLIIIFSKAQSLGGAIASLMAFSLFVQASEGSTFGIVPYLNPNLTGTYAGIIGAGGNAGAVIFSVIFRQTDYRTAFFYMGLATSFISLLSNFVWIKGYEGLFFRRRIPSER